MVHILRKSAWTELDRVTRTPVVYPRGTDALSVDLFTDHVCSHIGAADVLLQMDWASPRVKIEELRSIDQTSA